MRGIIPEFVWLLVYKTEDDPKIKPICVAYRTKYEAVAQVQRIAEELKEKIPKQDWLEDIEDKRGKHRFKMKAKYSDNLYVGLSYIKLV